MNPHDQNKKPNSQQTTPTTISDQTNPVGFHSTRQHTSHLTSTLPNHPTYKVIPSRRKNSRKEKERKQRKMANNKDKEEEVAEVPKEFVLDPREPTTRKQEGDVEPT
ncbi:hypothetical protein ACOSQ2_031191 [Xanthoceras sorbifolium]